MQSTPDIAPPSLSAVEVCKQKFPTIPYFDFLPCSIYHQNTAQNLCKQKATPFWVVVDDDIRLSVLNIMYHDRMTYTKNA